MVTIGLTAVQANDKEEQCFEMLEIHREATELPNTLENKYLLSKVDNILMTECGELIATQVKKLEAEREELFKTSDKASAERATKITDILAIYIDIKYTAKKVDRYAEMIKLRKK